MSDLDRFDRLVLAALDARPAVPAPAPVAPLLSRPVHIEREPVVHSTRPARFVDHGVCPMCGVDRIGIEYHGELRSGAKVHQVAVHAAGMRRTDRVLPNCLGARMRVTFVGGAWIGEPKS